MTIKETIKNELPTSRRRCLEIVLNEFGVDNGIIDEVFRGEDIDDIIYDIDSEFKEFANQFAMVIDCIGGLK